MTEVEGVEVPAIITTVHSDTMINVRCLGETYAGSQVLTSLHLYDERPKDTRHAAWWPPRV